MHPRTHRPSLPVIAVILAFVLSACNNQKKDIPFPGDNLHPQPITQPLQLSEAKKLNWLTVKTGGIKSVTRKLDIDALPSTPLDPNGFHPLSQPPSITHFDFNALPDTAFNLDKIPSEPLHFKTSVLAIPAEVKVGPPSLKTGTPLSILEIGKAQGLPDKNVFCMTKDSRGFIWIGSTKGIYRTDGEYMRTYAIPGLQDLLEDGRGRMWYISNNGVGIIDPYKGTSSFSKLITGYNDGPVLPRMILDDQGRIWVSLTSRRGVDVIDPQAETCKHLDRRSGLSGTETYGIFQDENKNFWLNSRTGGVDVINLDKGRLRHLRTSNGLASDTLRSVTGDKKGTVWIAYKRGGVAAINIAKGSIIQYGQGFDPGQTYGLLCDHKGMVWIPTNHGLYMVDPERGLAKAFKDADGFPEDYILGLLEDDKQRVWVGTYSAGVIIVEQGAEAVHLAGTKTVSSAMEDSSGKIWVGTGNEDDGIQILDREKNRMRQLNTKNGLGHNFIQNFLEVNGNIWITTNGGFDIVDLKHKTIEHTGKKEGLASDRLYSVSKDKRGDIWLTGPSSGVDRIDAARRTIYHAGVAQGLSDEDIADVKQDNAGRIWVATNKKGVDVIDPEKGTVQNLSNAPGLKDSCNRLLMLDKFDRIWIGTDKGIYVADAKRGTLTTITTKEGLCNNYITSLVAYEGSVVAGTKNKVSIITPPLPSLDTAAAKSSDKTWRIGLLASSEGLFNGGNTWATNVITRKGEYIWGGSGITILHDFKEEKDTATTYVTGMNVMGLPLSFASTLSLREHDTLWNAKDFYVKGKLPENTGYVQQKRFHWDSVSGPHSLPVNLHVPYDQNYIQFQFAQRSLGRQDSIFYSYILEGIDKKWSPVRITNSTENYLNLAPGSYTFKVCSRNISGAWGRPASFSFIIEPPWWQAWWAYALYVVSVAGGIWGFIHYRSKQLIRENRLLEEKVEQRTNQLKQSLDDLKTTQSQLIQSEKMASLGELTAGIAHEIQNPLNFVNNFSEVNIELTEELKDELEKLSIPPSEKSSLEKITENIRSNQEKITFHGKRADSIVKGMLQHSRNNNGQKDTININALADEYLRLAYHGLRAKDKSFNAIMKTDFDESLGSIHIVAQEIGRVVLNLITNAFYAVTEKKSQTSNGYEPTVTVTTRRMGGTVLISVSDNGNGIPQKVMHKIFQPFFTTKPAGQGTGLGLSLSYDIIKGHHGELKVETKEGEGAKFVITLPME